MTRHITIIGGGLAGTETAMQLACALDASPDLQDIEVHLYEMRPVKKTPAHHTGDLAELVCSNSLGSEYLATARGLLIREMQHFDSVIIESAIESKVPAGQALAVDRENFAQIVTAKIKAHPRIKIINEELAQIPETNEQNLFTVVATGPLTSEALAQDILRSTGSEFLNFFDAASPIVSADSIDMDIAFKASRYEKGTADYINCPFYEKEDYDRFYDELIAAEKAPVKDFEEESIKKTDFFEGCMPIDEIARRGRETLLFGPLKPVGLFDPRYQEDVPDAKTGGTKKNCFKKAYAVVQLRQDNAVASLYNIVGFQTNLKWGEQKRVFSMIPGLENMEIVRYGVMHQNIYLDSPKILAADLSLKSQPQIYFAGQITGVEGYTESAATGIIVARSIMHKLGLLRFARNDVIDTARNDVIDRVEPLPRETMLGALAAYISSEEIANAKQDFQPMNSNWGIVNTDPSVMEKQVRKSKKLRNEFLANRALALIAEAGVTVRAAGV